MKFFRPVVVVYCLSFGLVQSVNATLECKKMEFAELQSLTKSQLQLEYCLAQDKVGYLTKQIDLTQEMDRNTLQGASLDRKSGGRPTFDTSSVGKESAQGIRAKQDCQDFMERIQRIATKKKYNLKCD